MAPAAVNEIVAVVAQQHVVAVPAPDEVVAGAAVHHGANLAPDHDPVAASAAIDGDAVHGNGCVAPEEIMNVHNDPIVAGAATDFDLAHGRPGIGRGCDVMKLDADLIVAVAPVYPHQADRAICAGRPEVVDPDLDLVVAITAVDGDAVDGLRVGEP